MGKIVNKQRTICDRISESRYRQCQSTYHNPTECIYLYLPLLSVKEISVISDVKTLMRISSDGIINWTPGGIYETSCAVDVTYYPLDTQTCRYAFMATH